MGEWIDLALGAVRWRVQAAWRDLLFDDHGLRSAQWREHGQIETIKEAAHRAVHRVHVINAPLGAQASANAAVPVTIYLKHYPLSDLRAYLRQAVRPAKARGEAETALALAARGVPTVEPLAYGETKRGESWLITRGLDGVQQLNHFIEQTVPRLEPDEQLRLRFALTDALAQLMARLHDAGVTHPDLHAGNILVKTLRPHTPREVYGDSPVGLYLIDLHAVRLGEALAWPASRDNLVMLNRWFVQRSSRADRRRFWRIYYAFRSHKRLRMGPGGKDACGNQNEKAMARELESATWTSAVAFWRRRDRRCLGNNRYFYRLHYHHNTAWAVRDLPVETVRTLLADPDAPFARPDTRILKHSRSSTVAELALETGSQTRAVIYKRIMATKSSDPWLHLVRATPALRSWVNGHRLLDCGLPTPRPLAVLHRRRRGLTYECYLLTEKLPDAMELHKFVSSASQASARNRVTLIEQAARLVRALHDRQLTHRDLKAANILISGDWLWLIDLVGVERWRRLPRSRRIQNLARLHTSFHRNPRVSRTDKLRFLRVYLRWGLKGRGDWKSWWRAIAATTARKLAKNARRGRPVS